MYSSLYNLLNQYIFDNSVVVGSYEDLVLILMSSIGVIFLVALPFLLVKKVIDLL